MTDDHKRAGRPRDCTLDEQKVVCFTHLHHAQILCRDPAITHVAGHPHVLKDPAREQTWTDRPTATMPALRTVRHIATGKLVPARDALKAFALAGADHIHVLTGLKFLHRDLVADVELHGLFRAILADKSGWSCIGLFAVADERFAGVLRSEEHTSELQSRQYLVC